MIGRPDGGLQRSTHRHEHLVAGGVAMAIVHLFEPVEVDEHHERGGARFSSEAKGLVESLQQGGPIEQTGELVGSCPVSETFAGVSQVGDVWAAISAVTSSTRHSMRPDPSGRCR